MRYKELSCGIIPIDPSGSLPRLLLVQHRAGHWGFPKGHPEAGEGELQAAVRELLEETGLIPSEVLATYRYEERYKCRKKGRSIDKTVVYFPAIIEHTVVSVQLEEVMDHEWLEAGNARDRISFSQGQTLVDTFLADLPAILRDSSTINASEKP